MARGRNGVQYASIREQRVPMFDAAVAAKVAEHIAALYPQAMGPCDCGWVERYQAARATSFDPYTEHTAECASRTPVPFDAAALIEAKCGRYIRGAHKGALRGWAVIRVVAEGGWLRDGGSFRGGRVVLPGRVLSVSIEDFTGQPYLEVGVR